MVLFRLRSNHHSHCTVLLLQRANLNIERWNDHRPIQSPIGHLPLHHLIVSAHEIPQNYCFHSKPNSNKAQSNQFPIRRRPYKRSDGDLDLGHSTFGLMAYVGLLNITNFIRSFRSQLLEKLLLWHMLRANQSRRVICSFLKRRYCRKWSPSDMQSHTAINIFTWYFNRPINNMYICTFLFFVFIFFCWIICTASLATKAMHFFCHLDR